MTTPLLPTPRTSPTVTAAVFSHNYGQWMAQAIESAIHQTWPPIEIMLVDDGSTDSTPAVMDDYANKYQQAPDQIRLKRYSPNVGYATALSDAIGNAQGELVVVFSADDIAYPYRIARLAQAWDSAGRPATCLHSTADAIDVCERPLDYRTGPYNRQVLSDPVQFLRHGACMLGATIACPRSLFDLFGPFEVPGIGCTEDVALAFRSALMGGSIFIDEPLLQQRVGCGHSTRPPDPDVSRRRAKALADTKMWAACTEQMIMDYRYFTRKHATGDHKIPQLLANRQLLHRAVEHSFQDRFRSLWYGAATVIHGLTHSGLSEWRVLAKTMRNSMRGRFAYDNRLRK